MARTPVTPSLPPLKECLPDFTGFSAGAAKSRQISDVLRPIIKRHGQAKNLVFHTTREIARFFGVCQQTATLAVGLLEKEGLLRRIRGAHTVMTGSQSITRVALRAVVGFPLGYIESRYSYPHRRLSRELSDALWKHHMALDIISYIEIGGQLPDFTQRLHRHGLNFAVWLTPLSHNRGVLQHLEDQGVRNLVVDFNTHTAGFKANVVIDMLRAYSRVAKKWRNDFGLERVLVIEPSDYPRERIKSFVKIATEYGLACEVLKSTPTLAGEIEAAHREGTPVGVALLDERASAEFTFYEPAAFVAIARRHRVLYGNNYPEVPFAGHGETKIDRIYWDHPYLTDAIAATIVRWLNNDFTDQPATVSTTSAFGVPLWRYL